MTTLAAGRIPFHTLRHVPRPGEVGCPGACPLCTSATGAFAPPCLACRDELRARLTEMNLHHYVERAVN